MGDCAAARLRLREAETAVEAASAKVVRLREEREGIAAELATAQGQLDAARSAAGQAASDFQAAVEERSSARTANQDSHGELAEARAWLEKENSGSPPLGVDRIRAQQAVADAEVEVEATSKRLAIAEEALGEATGRKDRTQSHAEGVEAAVNSAYSRLSTAKADVGSAESAEQAAWAEVASASAAEKEACQE